MSEQTTAGESTQDGNNTSETTSGAGDEFKAITSQDDLNKVLNERLSRERAKYADYKDVKAKASRLDQIEEANKTEVQKLADRVTGAETERDAARVDMLRFKVAAKHGISEEDADLFLTGKDEEALTKQAERLAGREADRKKQGNYVPKEGTSSTAPENEERAFARQLFGSD